jgi:uncharacterized membrane protein
MRHRFEHPWMHGHHWIYGQHWLPGMFLSVLTTVFLAALLIGLAWVLLRWILPYILPMIADIFGWPPAENPPALEILRQRYAAGEIDAVTFEQMRERLEASYQQESRGFPPGANSYPRGTWTGYRDTFSSPGSHGQGSVKMAEQERYPPESER